VKIPLARPDITEAEIEAVVEVLKTSYLALGPKLKEFEGVIAEYAGIRYAVAVNSGTSALHLIIRALGIGEGDEVITTPFSFISSANCILYERARPVFVDIEPKTLNIDPELIEAAITPRTKAILAVDVFGHPAEWDRLKEIADKHGLRLIEDSAEALGAEWRNVRSKVQGPRSKVATSDSRIESPHDRRGWDGSDQQQEGGGTLSEPAQPGTREREYMAST
jgi:perosamine synthetase